MTIGENIKKYRKIKKMSQSQLGNIVGMSYQQIGQYENGKRNPKIATIKKIADALGVSVGDIDEEYGMGNKDYHMYRFSEVQEICKTLGISESELLGFDVQPEDYENIKNPRVYEVHYHSNKRTGNILKENKNTSNNAISNQFKEASVRTILKRELDDNFEMLNEKGVEKLINYSSDLTQITEYRKNPEYQNGAQDSAAPDREDN